VSEHGMGRYRIPIGDRKATKTGQLVVSTCFNTRKSRDMDLLAEIEAAADAEERTRAQWIKRACRAALERGA